MSTILNTNNEDLEVPVAPKSMRVAIITAKWNSKITHALRDGAIDVLHTSGINDDRIYLIDVPGTVELTYAASKVIKSLKPDAVIIIGCVIRGDTPHFDYVCESATQGMTILNAEGNAPVIFGVLTVENEQQALDRAGGCLGNKGAEAGVAAIEMAWLSSRIEDREI